MKQTQLITFNFSTEAILVNQTHEDVILKYRGCSFDVHRAVHCNITSIVKPTGCTNVSNLFYFGMTLYS